MISRPNIQFEIQVLTDKNWIIADLVSDEGQARAFADNLLRTGNHAAVRVVRDYRRADNLHNEKVILEKTAPARQAADLSLSPVAEAPPCTGIEDFFELPARVVMGRMLRRYLEELQVTPTELLHSAAELKRFGDRGNLLYSAIDRIATLQARAMGEDFRVRRDFLAGMWEQLIARARKLAARKLPTPKTAADLEKAVSTAGGEETEYLFYTLLSQRLLETRSWLGKLDILLDWSASEVGMVARMADRVIADLLVSAQLIQDLLGFQPNLAAALCQLLDLEEGKAEPAKYAPAGFAALAALFAKGGLPEARQVLLSRVTREIGGRNPLSRNEPRQEFEMFHRVLHRLVQHQGVVGGTASAEALLRRNARLLNLGGDAAQALDLVLFSLGDTCRRVQFLVALAGSSLGQELGVENVLTIKVSAATHIDQWVPVRLPPRDRMAALTAANKALRDADSLDSSLRRHLADHVDEVLARYLVEEGVIEKIDKPNDPLALRAIRLVKFCGSGVLIDGKSLNMARQRVIEHLRQKQFEEKFLASVPDQTQAEKRLREFHRLLGESGFR